MASTPIEIDPKTQEILDQIEAAKKQLPGEGMNTAPLDEAYKQEIADSKQAENIGRWINALGYLGMGVAGAKSLKNPSSYGINFSGSQLADPSRLAERAEASDRYKLGIDKEATRAKSIQQQRENMLAALQAQGKALSEGQSTALQKARDAESVRKNEADIANAKANTGIAWSRLSEDKKQNEIKNAREARLDQEASMEKFNKQFQQNQMFPAELDKAQAEALKSQYEANKLGVAYGPVEPGAAPKDAQMQRGAQLFKQEKGTPGAAKLPFQINALAELDILDDVIASGEKPNPIEAMAAQNEFTQAKFRYLNNVLRDESGGAITIAEEVNKAKGAIPSDYNIQNKDAQLKQLSQARREIVNTLMGKFGWSAADIQAATAYAKAENEKIRAAEEARRQVVPPPSDNSGSNKKPETAKAPITIDDLNSMSPEEQYKYMLEVKARRSLGK